MLSVVNYLTEVSIIWFWLEQIAAPKALQLYSVFQFFLMWWSYVFTNVSFKIDKMAAGIQFS